VRLQMGNNGRSWTGLFAFWAMAILVAALGPAPVPESPVVDAVVIDAATPYAVAPGTAIVASR